MTQPEIEPRSSGPLTNTLTIRKMSGITVICKLIIRLNSNFDMCYLKVSTL